MKLSNLLNEAKKEDDILEESTQHWMREFVKNFKRYVAGYRNVSDKKIIDVVGGKHRMLRLYRAGTDPRKAAMILARDNKATVRTGLGEAKDGDIHREYEPGEVFKSAREKGMIFIILYPYTAAKGVKKWTGVEFQMQPNYGEPYMSSAEVTTAGDDLAFKGYKKIKLTSKMKKQIQKILKDPEELDRIERSDTKVRDIERYIR